MKNSYRIPVEKLNAVPECNLLRPGADFKADHSSKTENIWLVS